MVGLNFKSKTKRHTEKLQHDFSHDAALANLLPCPFVVFDAIMNLVVWMIGEEAEVRCVSVGVLSCLILLLVQSCGVFFVLLVGLHTCPKVCPSNMRFLSSC